MQNYYPSTFLSMEPTGSSAAAMAVNGERSDQDRQQISLSLPAPDINLPLSADISTPPPSWSSDSYEILDLSPHKNDADAAVLHLPKLSSRKCTKRVDSFDKSDLKLDVFLVQHDMENMYMWVFKEKPENALGKMQLRSYMNGHSRLDESQFPFSVDKGFVRSHRMQRKHYKGLSNPQCIHGIEFSSLPNSACIPESDKRRWLELTGRDLSFPILPEASDFVSWRNLPCADFDSSNRLNHDGDAVELSTHCGKRRKDSPQEEMEEDCCLLSNNLHPDRAQDMEIHPMEPLWVNDFSGVMRHAYGPVAAAKTIYEDDVGYLIMVSLPFSDQNKVKVFWRNDLTHGIVKIHCMSTGQMPLIKRHGRTFRLTDASPEHCPPGEFVREISLATRIHEDARIEAYYDETGTILEIMVPKHASEPEEHEVHVSMHPPISKLMILC
ncbi:hypothetical protein KSP39_PZI017744 [Platanthera zijinensis]|uniref:HSP20-like chaperones superfamily protein n=1 Tax=Platanthera zijinensis TaxID=2320716 RepID=A0AAP0B6W6_9ASPA